LTDDEIPPVARPGDPILRGRSRCTPFIHQLAKARSHHDHRLCPQDAKAVTGLVELAPGRGAVMTMVSQALTRSPSVRHGA
jgi:hypothetical protein